MWELLAKSELRPLINLCRSPKFLEEDIGSYPTWTDGISMIASCEPTTPLSRRPCGNDGNMGALLKAKVQGVQANQPWWSRLLVPWLAVDHGYNMVISWLRTMVAENGCKLVDSGCWEWLLIMVVVVTWLLIMVARKCWAEKHGMFKEHEITLKVQ